jgi:hypothetical protein
MIGDAGTTTEELLAAWRQAESDISDTNPGSAERVEATHLADEARERYQARVDMLRTLAMDLRDA